MGKGMWEERRAREARIALVLEPDCQLPEGGLGRVLALWGFTSVSFFRAFRDPTVDDASMLESRDRDTRISLGEGSAQ